MLFARTRTAFARSRARHLRTGRRGERLAARLLRELGLDLLMRNYRCRAGEIDLIARDGEVLCFVEVKTRRRAWRYRPADAVGSAKRRHLIRAAHSYLRELGRPPLRYRFDIVEIVLPGRQPTEAYYWKAAFDEEQPARPDSMPQIPPQLRSESTP
jgi:putative endonuclease